MRTLYTRQLNSYGDFFYKQRVIIWDVRNRFFINFFLKTEYEQNLGFLHVPSY